MLYFPEITNYFIFKVVIVTQFGKCTVCYLINLYYLRISKYLFHSLGSYFPIKLSPTLETISSRLNTFLNMCTIMQAVKLGQVS